MPQQTRRWEVCQGVPESVRNAVPKLDPMLAQLLYNRGLLGSEQPPDAGVIERFLTPRWEGGLHDPFLMAGMDRAVERILSAIEHGESIGVFGHYDADGITATALLTETLHHLGARAVPYLPDRSDEYGVNAPGIAELASQGARLLVSVDSGIRSFGAPRVAAQHDMEVILTDHHTVLREDGRDVLPEAVAVLNPLRADCAYPCKSLAGVGVAFKLAQALLRADAQRRGNGETNFAKWLLDLVCLGTVADVVEITDENRTLVRLGIEIMRRSHRPGMRALLGVAGTNVSRLDVTAIAFQLAPRLNAAARLESAWSSLALLRAADTSEAGPLAQQLDLLNRERQRVTQQAMDQIAARYGDALGERKAIVAVGEWAPGIIGLIAGKLSEGYNRPAAVVECSGEECHGSARSRPSFHIADALAECGDLLTRFGGHAQAAGFSLPARNLEPFSERLNALAEAQISDEDLEPVVVVDALVQPAQVTPELLALAQALEPCGQGNPAPVFGMHGARLASAESFGAKGAHLRLSIEAPNRPLRATAWRMGALAADLRPGDEVSVAFSLREDRYYGMSLEVLDVASP